MNKYFVFLLSGALFLPGIAFASSEHELALSPFRPALDSIDKAKEAVEKAENRVEGEVCKRLNSQTERLLKTLSERSSRVEERIATRAERLATDRNERDQALTENRAKHTERRSEMYARLRARAETPEEQAAVDAFEAAIEDAVGARQSASDAAIETFREGVDTLSKSHVSAVLERKEAFVGVIEDAAADALDDCAIAENNGAPEAGFRKAVADARQKLMTEQLKNEELSDAVSDLAEARRDTIEEANRAFRIKVQEATLALKDAFGE